MDGGRVPAQGVGQADLPAVSTPNDAALAAILAEWDSDRDYSNADGRGTGTGTDFDNRLNADFFLDTEGDDATVYDDGAKDVMTGSSGCDEGMRSSPLPPKVAANDRPGVYRSRAERQGRSQISFVTTSGSKSKCD